MRYSIFKTILSGVLMTLALAGYSQIAEEIITEETPATQEQQKGVSSGSSIEAIDGVTRKTLMKDRKSTRLNSSHVAISYAVFCSKTRDRSRRRPPPGDA